MKILREMAISSQGRESFDYEAFRRRVSLETFLPGQKTPLQMRLEVLESFFEPEKTPKTKKNIWKFDKGTLTIIDLSCPFVDSDDACALFNICISFFLKDRHQAGRIIALDEAHKVYMILQCPASNIQIRLLTAEWQFLNATSPEAIDLSETLLSIIRQQRHLGTRVVIATQEPTISPSLLDLCNLAIIHRFNSPSWFKAIKSHVAGAKADDEIFQRIVCLATGEALIFCPTALIEVEKNEVSDHGEESAQNPQIGGGKSTVNSQVVQIGPRHLYLRVRRRITLDGGRSIMEK